MTRHDRIGTDQASSAAENFEIKQRGDAGPTVKQPGNLPGEPAGDAGYGGAPTSLWAVPGMISILVAVTCAFGAWSILLPVVPLAVLDAGGSATLAGGSTGAFMAATVLTQALTPRLLRLFGYKPTMAVAAFMLGVPALGHLLGMDGWIVLLFSALRGVGFGALTVSQSALIAELVPLRWLGKATGTLGVFVGIAQMIFLPVGLWLQDSYGFSAPVIIAAIIGVVALLLCLRLPRLKPERADLSVADEPDKPRAATWKLVAVPALALAALAMSYGVVSTFLPASVRELDSGAGAVLGGIMLSIVGGAILLSRFCAGVFADRVGEPGRLYLPAAVIGIVGMGLMSATVLFSWSVVWLVVAAILFGVAFGTGQNEALLSMFERLPREKISEASAIWNIFYDGGTGVGSVALAAAVGGFGYAGAFGAGSAVIAVAVVILALDLYLGRHRVTEYDNIKTRLSRLRKV